MSVTKEYVPPGFISTLGQRVFAAAVAKDNDFWAASVEIWKGLSKSEQYTLGLWALVAAEREAFRQQHPSVQDSSTSLSRRAIALSSTDPLSYVVAIGNTGVRKCIGELTHEDLMTIADYYGAHKRAYADKEAAWRIIAGRVPAGKTVAEVRGNLSQLDRVFLLGDVGAADPQKNVA